MAQKRVPGIDKLDRTSPTHVAYCRAFSLLHKIGELRAERKTSREGPETLLDILASLSKGAIRRVSALTAQLSGIPDDNREERKAIQNTIRTVVLLINRLYAFLRYVDATRLSRNPTGMIKPWELLIKEYAGHKFPGTLSIIIRPQWKYNYTYYNLIAVLSRISEIIEDEDSKEELNHIGQYFPLLSFAGLERDNTLLHVVLAHEIGHFVDDIHGISQIKNHRKSIITNLDSPPISEKLEKFFKLSISLWEKHRRKAKGPGPALSHDLFLHQALSQAQAELAKKIETWLSELTADLLAVRIAGPSFIFALYQTQLAQVSKAGPAGDYPPPQIRIENCIKYWNAIDKDESSDGSRLPSKHLATKRTITRYLERIAEKEKEPPPAPSDIDKLFKERYDLLTVILEEAVKIPLESIKQLIREKVERFSLDAIVFELAELLKSRVAPISADYRAKVAAHVQCDIASILNAGWIYWLTHDIESPNGKPDSGVTSATSLDEVERFCYQPLVEISNLVLKAIEQSDFTKRFANLGGGAKLP